MPRRGKKGELIESPTFQKVYPLRTRPQTSLYTCDLEKSQEIENFYTDNISPEEVTKSQFSKNNRKNAVINATTPVKKSTGRPRRTPKPTPKAIAELNSGFTDLELKTPKTTPIKTPTTRKRIRKTAIVAKRNLQESFSGIDSKGDQSSRAKRVPVKKEPKKATKSAQLANENIHDKEPAIEASPSKHTQFRKLEKKIESKILWMI